jgi:hypothetical protein
MDEAYFTHGERRKADRFFVDMPEEKTRQGKHRHSLEDTIKIY